MRHLPNLKLPEATPLLGGRVRPPETGMLPFHLGESAAEQAVMLPTGLLPCPVPASRHLCGLDSKEPGFLL